MKFTSATIAAAAAFLPSLASAHMFMSQPSNVFVEPDTGNFPLDPTGSNFPCGVNFAPGKFDNNFAQAPVFEPGTSQSVGISGSAVHGGGSCQISFTYDSPPTANSVFRVVKSFEGGCPVSTAGNLAASQDFILSFLVPEDLPSGDAIVAWTWFNKIGNREMYMRCAPVTIGGSNSDKSAFNKLPEILKANIGNGCSTKEGDDVAFPNPGPQLEGTGTGSPVGNCGSYAPPTDEEPEVEEPEVEIPEVDAPILIEDPTEEEPPVQPPTSTKPPTPTKPPVVEPPKVTSAPPPTATKPPVQPPKETPAPPSNGTSCKVDGAIVCTSPTSWAVCNFGVLVPMGETAAGINCKNGEMVVVKREIRFSKHHMRRRHHF